MAVIEGIGTVCYVGAGTMGCYNALVAAMSGYHVVLYDVDEAALTAVRERQREMAALLVGAGYCAADDVPDALDRVAVQADLALAVAHADLISESVAEHLAIKREIHRQLDVLCPPRTILTTNTSALRVSDIESAVERGERFAALHSHLGSPLVDIVAGPRTDRAVVDILQRYVLSLGGEPLVLKKEHPGYVLNAMLGPVLRTALALVLDGVTGFTGVDRAWMLGRRATMGPFGMMDLFGLNVIADSWRNRRDSEGGAGLRANVLALLEPYLARGELGMKSGQGFYRYPEPTYQRADFLAAEERSAVAERALLVALLSSAIALAAEDVAAPADIDRAWTVGTYLDQGPFSILATMGASELQQALAAELESHRIDADTAGRVREWLRRNPLQSGDSPCPP
jgi:3-hydroxybutyryl-CoA dehydrogenase